MNLDELETKARAAKDGPRRLLIDSLDKEFIAAASPDVVLKLIAVARAAEACCIDNAGRNYGIPSEAMRDALDAVLTR